MAARGNFCTLDNDGKLLDRRAGRISSEESAPLCEQMDQIEAPGVEARVFPVKDYRFVALFRGQGLSERVTETDPQVLGVPPRRVEALDPQAAQTAIAANALIEGARELLADRERANMVMLRGFSQLPELPDFGKTYQLNPAAIAAYPMYRGLAKVCGMTVIPTGVTFRDEVDTLSSRFQEHDFFYLHYKHADAAGEDGDFDAKVHALEEVDEFIPELVDLNPDALIVAGDHATPSILAAHSWHPVPLLIHSNLTLGEGVAAFDERNCALGVYRAHTCNPGDAPGAGPRRQADQVRAVGSFRPVTRWFLDGAGERFDALGTALEPKHNYKTDLKEVISCPLQ